MFTPQACRDFLDVADSHSRRWQKALQHEREQRHHLEETIEQLAKQHNSLERAWRESPATYTGETHHTKSAKTPTTSMWLLFPATDRVSWYQATQKVYITHIISVLVII